MTSQARKRLDDVSIRAARLLFDGAFIHAADCWRSSLHSILPLLLSGSDSEGMSSLPDSCVSARAVPAIPHHNSAHFDLDERVFCIYSSPFLFVSSCENGEFEWGQIDIRRMSVALCYNVALAHHLCALQGEANRKHFEMALQAYKAARDLLLSLTVDVSMLPDDLKILALAIANNEGQMSEQMRLDTTSSYVMELRTLLSNVPVSRESLHFHEAAVRATSLSSSHFQAPAA